MKTKIIAVMTILCLVGATAAFARGKGHGYRGHHGHGHRGSYHYGYDGYGIALGVAGGLLLGSALSYAAPPPPPPPVVYEYRTRVYQPEVVVYQRPRACYEDQIVRGEWQVSGYDDDDDDGHRVWISYPNPVTRRVEIPCY